MTTLITRRHDRLRDRPVQADVLVDGETIAAVVAPGDTALGGDLAATVDTVIDATGKYVIPGGVDVPYPHGAAVRRDQRLGHLRDRHDGGRMGRDDDDHRLRRPAHRGARPIAFIGPDSERGRAAALAAAAQNRMFNFMEMLYFNQGPENTGWLDEAMVEAAAASIPGLDVPRLVSARGSAAVKGQERRRSTRRRKPTR